MIGVSFAPIKVTVCCLMSIRAKSRSRSNSILGMKRNSFIVTQNTFTDSIQDYEITQTIGVIEDISHGYLAKHIPSKRLVCLKMTDFNMSSEYELIQEMADIVRNTRMCSHSNILNYYTSFVEQERLWTVVDPIRLGSIKQLMIENFPNGLPTETIIATMLKEVLKATAYLHNRQCIHNNIRADNVYLDSTGDVRLGGLHQMIETMTSGTLKRSVFKFVGDPEWMSPEVLSQATTFNEKIDIYSIGILALELYYGRTPFQGWPALKILLCKLHYEVPPIETDRLPPSKAFARFIERCLHKYPRLRPTALELLDDPFIKNGRNTQYLESHLVRKLHEAGEHEVNSPVAIHEPVERDEEAEHEEQ